MTFSIDHLKILIIITIIIASNHNILSTFSIHSIVSAGLPSIFRKFSNRLNRHLIHHLPQGYIDVRRRPRDTQSVNMSLVRARTFDELPESTNPPRINFIQHSFMRQFTCFAATPPSPFNQHSTPGEGGAGGPSI